MEKKRVGFIAVLVSSIFAITLASCGIGGGEVTPDTIEVTITGSAGTTTTTTYTEGPINSEGYYDPYMEANIYPTTGRTWITLSSGVTDVSTMPDIVINIWVGNHVVGEYTITGKCAASSTTCVRYQDHGQDYDSIASGKVIIENIGNVGDPVKGSFSAVVALSTAPSTTMAISGTFNVKREN